jgi:hypothetical protein
LIIAFFFFLFKSFISFSNAIASLTFMNSCTKTSSNGLLL